MRRLILLFPLLLLPLAGGVFGEEIGGFFTKVNAYAYPDGPSQGRRVLVRPRKFFSVVNVAADVEDKFWLQIIHPGQQKKVTGEGWTPLAPHELLSASTRSVKIYEKIVEREDAPVNTLEVPAIHLQLLNLTQPGGRFRHVTWQKVRYETTVPVRLWIRRTAGVFRPGKSSEFLGRVYAEMVSRNLPKEKLNRLISGVVRVGDSPWDVEHALGKPLRVTEDTTAETMRAKWEYLSLVVKFKNEVVEQVN